VAGFVIPATSLLVPLLTRQHHWTAAIAGLIVGAQAAGGITVALAVARRGPAARPGPAAAAGLAAIAAGELLLGLAPVKALAIAGAVVMGLGTGASTCNLGPVLMGAAPRTHLGDSLTPSPHGPLRSADRPEAGLRATRDGERAGRGDQR